MLQDMLSEHEITNDPSLPCLHCNRYTCRCHEVAIPASLLLQAGNVEGRDWTPWMTAAAACA